MIDWKEDSWKGDKANFIHDCSECRFLGVAHDNGSRVVDLYICNDLTIVARFGNEGFEYGSAPLSVAFKMYEEYGYTHVGLALQRAIDEGYITGSDILKVIRYSTV